MNNGDGMGNFIAVRQLVAAAIAERVKGAPRSPAFVEARLSSTQTITWQELQDSTIEAARRLTASIAGPAVLAVETANTLAGMVGLVAALRCGALVLPIDRRAPLRDRHLLLQSAARRFGTVYTWPGDDSDPTLYASFPGAPEHAGDFDYLLAGGGTSGLPQLTATTVPGGELGVLGGFHLLLRRTGWKAGQRQLVPGPLYHSAPFTCFLGNLCEGGVTVVHGAFSPAKMIGAITSEQIQWMQLTPAHMRAVLRDGAVMPDHLASLRGVLHTAAPCDAMTKRGWIDLLGPKRLFETYGATEQIGMTLASGEDWLRRPGTVGKGFLSQVRILREGRTGPVGEVGTVYLRRAGARRDLRGVQHTPSGFLSVGDHGWIDADGYLFLVGRRADMMTVGGANVYPTEIETCIQELPGVLDVGVISAEHADLGAVPHALVVAALGADLSAETVRRHCRERLAVHKIPRQVDFVAELPRRENGKLLRAGLGTRAEPAPAPMREDQS
jgi:bile acid-coenzyme A ligase